MQDALTRSRLSHPACNLILGRGFEMLRQQGWRTPLARHKPEPKIDQAGDPVKPKPLRHQ